MNQESRLQLQAYLDGELPEDQVRTIEAQLKQDATANALLAELRQTRSFLAGQDLVRPVPESREFYWSRIARQIEKESARHERETSRPAAWMRWLRLAFSPVGGVVATAVLALASVFWFYGASPIVPLHETEVNLPDAQMLTFHDQQERMTVVWLTYNK